MECTVHLLLTTQIEYYKIKLQLPTPRQLVSNMYQG
jgi:hypothetical protein